MMYRVDFLASYEGEGTTEGVDGADPAGTPAAAAAAAQAAANKGGRTFTQEEVNKFLADDRRKHSERYQSLESSYQEVLKTQNLTKEERERLEQQLDDLRKQHRTKEQQLALDKKEAEEAHHKEVEALRKEKTVWEQRYTESTIVQALQSAAIKHEAFNPNQIIVQLRGQTKLVDKLDHAGKTTGQLIPMVEMTVKNESSGASEQLQMTPDEAVEYMKKNPEQWGNFFRNNVREGIGSISATGGAMTGNGTVDHTRLNDEQWFKLRKENPAALGLKGRR